MKVKKELELLLSDTVLIPKMYSADKVRKILKFFDSEYRDKKVPCRKSKVQEYQCVVTCIPKWSEKPICFDACLAKELFYLWDKGIQTTGSCCGKHVDSKKGMAYIGVKREDVSKMKKLGYEVVRNQGDRAPNFIPKSNIN